MYIVAYCFLLSIAITMITETMTDTRDTAMITPVMDPALGSDTLSVQYVLYRCVRKHYNKYF